LIAIELSCDYAVGARQQRALGAVLLRCSGVTVVDADTQARKSQCGRAVWACPIFLDM